MVSSVWIWVVWTGKVSLLRGRLVNLIEFIWKRFLMMISDLIINLIQWSQLNEFASFNVTFGLRCRVFCCRQLSDSDDRIDLFKLLSRVWFTIFFIDMKEFAGLNWKLSWEWIEESVYSLPRCCALLCQNSLFIVFKYSNPGLRFRFPSSCLAFS